MTERLAFLPVAFIAVLVAVRLDLTYVGLAILAGIAIPIYSLVRGREPSDDANDSYAYILIGLALLLLAHLVCNHYGMSFEALDQDKTFPKAVRRLPYFGIALLTSGGTTMAISIFRRQ